MKQHIKSIQVDLAKLEEAREKHICPVCGKECKKHSTSTKNHPRWKIFCSKECQYSEYGKAITYNLYKKSCLEKHGVENTTQLESVKQKTKQTMIKKYGAEHPLQVKEFHNKAKQTCLERYDTETPCSLDVFKEKAKQTCIKNYGVDNPNKNKEVRARAKQTCIKKYGKEHPSQIDEIKEKKKQTTEKHYGFSCIFSDENYRVECTRKMRDKHWDYFKSALEEKNISPLFSKEDYLDQNENSHRFLCVTCNKEFVVFMNNTMPQKIYCPEKIHNNRSLGEQEIYDWILSLGVKNVERNKRDWGKKRYYEADIYLPDYNFVIEYNGLYWHSNAKKTKDYHYEKWKFFKDMGINCIQIFENEWEFKKDIVKNILLSKLGLLKVPEFEEYTIKDISEEEFESFVNENCAFKSEKYDHQIGLLCNDELMCVLSYSENSEYIKIDLVCEKLGYCSNGKLFALFIDYLKAMNKSIIYFVDIRYFEKTICFDLGFRYYGHLNPEQYFFNKKSVILYRELSVSLLKSYEPELSDEENATLNNYFWIYDCGKDIFILK